jgi:hypothetical protein
MTHLPQKNYINLGFMDAAWLNAWGKAGRLTVDGKLVWPGNVAAVVALILWGLTILCSCLNAEPPPRLYLGS